MAVLNFILYCVIFFFALMMIMTVIFPRISIRHIESKMQENGVSPPSWDRGIGASAPFYALAIFVKRARKSTPLFDGRFVAKHARPIDKFLAFLHLVSTSGFIISIFLMVVLEYFLL